MLELSLSLITTTSCTRMRATAILPQSYFEDELELGLTSLTLPSLSQTALSIAVSSTSLSQVGCEQESPGSGIDMCPPDPHPHTPRPEMGTDEVAEVQEQLRSMPRVALLPPAPVPSSSRHPCPAQSFPHGVPCLASTPQHLSQSLT